MAAILPLKRINRIITDLSIDSQTDASRLAARIRSYLETAKLSKREREVLEFTLHWRPNQHRYVSRGRVRYMEDGLIRISDCNSKMRYPSWDVLAGLDCPCHTLLCYVYCYARKSQAYPAVVNYRARNKCAEQRPDFVRRMVRLLRRAHKKWEFDGFRIYSAGDFADKGVYDKWCEICDALPEVRFVAFTQTYHLAKYDSPSNLTRIWSVWPDTDWNTIPDGHIAVVGGGKLDDEYGVPALIRYYPEIPAEYGYYPCTKQCGLDCQRCYSSSPTDVFFDLH